MFLAAQNGQWRIVKMILEQDYHRRKISPGFKSSPNNWYADLPRFDGVTPLWMAAQMDNNHIIRLLLRAGASPTIPRNVCAHLFFFSFTHLLKFQYITLLVLNDGRDLWCVNDTIRFCYFTCSDYDILSSSFTPYQFNQSKTLFINTMKCNSHNPI